MIRIRGAREHNLKNVSLDLPAHQLIVFTGLSGSGKSSLAFDTLYAEGQRRYVESLSAYARQFLEMMAKPDVDSIEGLSPAISIEQKTTSKNPRSTVGTVTEIYDYLRLLFARVGIAYSPTTGKPIQSLTRAQMADQVMMMPEKTRFYILSPIALNAKGEYRKEFLDLQRKGFQRVKIDENFFELDQVPLLAKNKRHNIYAVIDRLSLQRDPDFQQRILEGIESALGLSDGLVYIEPVDSQVNPFMLSSKLSCPDSGFSLPEIEPRLFSFNSPSGACPACSGLGVSDFSVWDTNYSRFLEREEEPVDEEDIQQTNACTVCQGKRLCPAALCVRVADLNIAQVCELSIRRVHEWCDQIYSSFSSKTKPIAERILKEIQSRLSFLLEVGLDYLTLQRSAGTLSGGESQRIRLASQIGSGLTGVLYVLDEPSIGLHQRDNDRLLKTLTRLRDLGNSVIVVEHDEDAIRSADYIVDLGPKAGRFGGEIVAKGTLDDILSSAESLTGAYLRKERFIEVPRVRREGNGLSIRVVGAHKNNLKNLSVDFPLGKLICVTGVSGGGKSSLIIDTLYKGSSAFLLRRAAPGGCKEIQGLEHIDKVIDIDQSPIGRTPRSNPATYVGLFTPIREWFSFLPEARTRGYQPGRFSFNVKGGRCEACQGEGSLKIQMHFLPDMTVECEVCRGKRYSREILDIRFKQASIADVLNMPVEEAKIFFEPIHSIANRLQTLEDVGLGYVQLGQKATTLSGGEAQRVKLAKELSRRSTGKTLYILDEPTTGLHFEDIRQLLGILHRLVDQGNTVIIIEHNLDVIKTADWVIDIGPEGGDLGGGLVACGTPEQVAQVDQSYTARYLRPLLS
jgi:excinuclease ABC subunit A